MNAHISNLEKKILQARNAYYNSDAPVMSDKEFDTLIDELRSLDPNNKAITAIGAPVQSEWKKAKHQMPMGSLDKVNQPVELVEWASNVAPNENLFLTLKLDGISIELIYENGKFVQAITRGDGFIGEDISVNVIRMRGVKATINSFTGSLRGEIILTKSNHQKYFSDKANPRNAASGLSKRLDGVGCEKLNIICYQAIGDVDFKTEVDQFEWLKDNGLDIPPYWLFKSYKEVNNHWRSYQDKERNNLDYDIDGLVVRVNNLEKQISLGDKDLRPKGAIAYKFDNDAKETTLLGVTWQVGSMGRVSPVASIETVILSGAKVSRASLYNMTYIEKLGLDIGATVLVSRCNDVIPRVEKVIKGTGKILKKPRKCPECLEDLEEDGEYLVCTNTFGCPAQMVGRLKNWVRELNLLEWGDELLVRVANIDKVRSVADLYRLSVNDLASLERMGEKSAKKCFDILWANTSLSLEVFLGALSIPMIGQSTIKSIMNAGYSSLEDIRKLSIQDFEKVPGVGPNKAQSLFNGLKVNEDLIEDLLDVGIVIKEKIVGKLSGKSICFTGAMKNKRPVLEQMASDAGADVKSSVGKSCTYLVIADPNSQSAKAIAARKLGTVLISEEQFLEMVK